MPSLQRGVVAGGADCNVRVVGDLRLQGRPSVRDEAMMGCGSDTAGVSEPVQCYWARACMALTSAALKAFPPIAHSPLATS
jgi:hypothetical protein